MMVSGGASAKGMSPKSILVTAFALLVLVLLMLPPIREALAHGNHLWIRIFFFSWALSALLTPLAVRLSFSLGWLDIPKGRKDHGNATPLLGGFAIIATFGIALLVNYHYSLQMKAVGIASALIWLVGVIDDRRELSSIYKLLAQLVAVGILLKFGVHVTFMPNTWWGDYLEFIITALWVIGVTNAVNFLDGMDGLAAGMSAIIAFFLAIVAVQTGQQYFSFVALALFGACLGFLPHNFRWGSNARIFLGDNGSTFLGFVLASAVIMGNWAEDNIGDIAIPFLLMAVPIFDMTLTTVMRIATGKVKTFREWLDYAGRDHFHHRLASLGIGRSAAVLVIWFITFFMGMSAVVMKDVHGIYVVLLLIQGALLFGLITFFMIYVRNHQIRLFVEASQDSTNGGPDPDALDKALNSSDKPLK
ncbi:undecaprenyl/decaprenyl-phosphate alpha-N-acetylglucosaminyl 1-phosphate transferase [bacterium]|nr:undecaprenyl/decaprenyl-phosphate alpha-N-acetylglucosaminyl 1-phosphate transferase [bacterium]